MCSLRHLLAPSVAAVALCGSSGLWAADADEASEKTTPRAELGDHHFAFLETYCIDCHDADTEEGEVNLDYLSLEVSQDLPTAELWQKVLDALNAGEMPPEDKDQPKSAEKAEFLSALSGELMSARSILGDAGGRITLRRLSRRDYQNTIRELLGVEVDVSDLPDDTAGEGFDTAGASLFFSSDQFERYLELGQRAIDAAWEGSGQAEEGGGFRRRIEAEDVIRPKVEGLATRLEASYARVLARRAEPERPATEFGFIDNDRVKFEEGVYNRQHPAAAAYLADPLSESGALMVVNFNGSVVVDIPLPDKAPAGDYTLRVRVGAMGGALPHERYLEYGLRVANAQAGEIEVLGCRRVGGDPEEPSVIEIPVRVDVGTGRKFVLRARQQNSRDAMRHLFQVAKAANKVVRVPTLWIDWAEWEAADAEGGPVVGLRDQLFFRESEGLKPWNYADEIIARFAGRAFRGRSVTPEFLQKLVSYHEARIAAGANFSTALKETLAVVLASPSFLYLSEPAVDGESRVVDDVELASRLSYFLWSGPPDAELLALAAEGRLGRPKVLRAQTERLLHDPRAMGFIDGFAHQWLDMERLDFFQFTPRKYPAFDDSLKAAARQEIYETLLDLLRNGRGIGQLLSSDHVVINDVLADHYGIAGVEGAGFQRVEVPEGNPRGGLLSTTAVLAMGSDGDRTSPVERGAWVLRHLLNDPPPPAPANVPQLSRLAGELTSAREIQAAHQEEPQCAQCHRDIDPIGFGMENFDASGAWRSEELVEVVGSNRRVTKSKAFPIDPSGTLPDGARFSSFAQLRNKIAGREDAVARSFTEALIGFGLARPYGFSDLDLADAILAEAAENENSATAFLHALIQSDAFRRK